MEEHFWHVVTRNDVQKIRAFLKDEPSWARLRRSDGLEPIDCLWFWQPSTVEEGVRVLECIDLLMSFGATPNTGRCVRELLRNCTRASIFLRALIRHGCTATTEDLILALRRSIFDDMEGLIPALLRAGADPNGATLLNPLPVTSCMILPTLPLHYAVAKRNVVAVFALLEGGADPYRADSVTSLTALDWARHVAAFPSRAVDPVAKRILSLFEHLQACRAMHAAVFPDLKKELMEYTWHPSRLARRGYFDL
jgi:hypothetical protein